MQFQVLTIIVVLHLIFCANKFDYVSGNIIPEGITQCHYEDSNCLQQTIQNILHTFGTTGIRKLNLMPFDPLRVNSLELQRSSKSPVSVELHFQNVDIIGLSNAKVSKVSGFDKELKKDIVIKASIDKLTLKGPYSIDGKVLILPIVGHGNSMIVLDDVQLTIKLKPNVLEKSGQKYLEVVPLQLDMVPQHVTFQLEGLFNGDKALGDNMNLFINENWSDVFNELKPDMSVALSMIGARIISDVYAKYPYEEYFLN